MIKMEHQNVITDFLNARLNYNYMDLQYICLQLNCIIFYSNFQL